MEEVAACLALTGQREAKRSKNNSKVEEASAFMVQAGSQ